MNRIDSPPAEQASGAGDCGGVLQNEAALHATEQSTTTEESIEQNADYLCLAEENRKLSAENRRLKSERSGAEVARFMERLRDAGKLTPALERCGVEQALLSAEEQQFEVQFPNGNSLPLAAILRELLNALPVAFSVGEYGFENESAHAAPLSADEMYVAAQLGLSEAEYAAMKCEA